MVEARTNNGDGNRVVRPFLAVVCLGPCIDGGPKLCGHDCTLVEQAWKVAWKKAIVSCRVEMTVVESEASRNWIPFGVKCGVPLERSL